MKSQSLDRSSVSPDRSTFLDRYLDRSPISIIFHPSFRSPWQSPCSGSVHAFTRGHFGLNLNQAYLRCGSWTSVFEAGFQQGFFFFFYVLGPRPLLPYQTRLSGISPKYSSLPRCAANFEGAFVVVLVVGSAEGDTPGVWAVSDAPVPKYSTLSGKSRTASSVGSPLQAPAQETGETQATPSPLSSVPPEVLKAQAFLYLGPLCLILIQNVLATLQFQLITTTHD
jgi:hypothetical protein